MEDRRRDDRIAWGTDGPTARRPDRHLLPANQSIDIGFSDFMADDVGVLDRIYALAGQPMTPSVRSAMEAFMAEHPRGKHGRVAYDLADFGLDRNERRAALAFYIESFAVDEEPA